MKTQQIQLLGSAAQEPSMSGWVLSSGDTCFGPVFLAQARWDPVGSGSDMVHFFFWNGGTWKLLDGFCWSWFSMFFLESDCWWFQLKNHLGIDFGFRGRFLQMLGLWNRSPILEPLELRPSSTCCGSNWRKMWQVSWCMKPQSRTWFHTETRRTTDAVDVMGMVQKVPMGPDQIIRQF